MNDGEAVNGAAAGNLGPLRVIRSAFCTELPWEEAKRAAITAFLQQQFVLAGALPIRRGIGIDDGFGKLVVH